MEVFMKILVVIDMQNDFIYGPLSTPEAAAIVPKVAEKILSWPGPVYATQDTHFPDYLQTQEGRVLPVEHCIQGTNGWHIAPAVRAALSAAAGREESTLYLTKSTFGSRDLAEVLVKRHQEEGVEEIMLVGLCTDICVISNALVLKTFLPEVPISVDASCCAGVNPDSHSNALAAMRMCQINVCGE